MSAQIRIVCLPGLAGYTKQARGQLLSVFCLLLLVSGWSGWLRQLRLQQEHQQHVATTNSYQQTLRELGTVAKLARCTRTASRLVPESCCLRRFVARTGVPTESHSGSDPLPLAGEGSAERERGPHTNDAFLVGQAVGAKRRRRVVDAARNKTHAPYLRVNHTPLRYTGKARQPTSMPSTMYLMATSWTSSLERLSRLLPLVDGCQVKAP